MIRTHSDPEALARAAAESVKDAALASIAARGAFRFGVSGGTTPARLYRLLTIEYARSFDWALVAIRYADERAVPPDHPDSNHRLVCETLIAPLGLRDDQVARMRGEAEDLESAALEYEPAVAEPLDLLLLGIGPDGHTASIFPGSAVVADRVRRVRAVHDSPKPPPRRLTVTPRVIAEARDVVVLASGAEKAEAVARALAANADPRTVPAALVRHRTWHIDRAAASRLELTTGGAPRKSRARER